MPMDVEKNKVVLRDIVGPEVAEALLEEIRKNPNRKVDLSACTHLHAANVQVLAAGRCKIILWPKDNGLKMWLKTILTEGTKEVTNGKVDPHR